MSKSLGNVVAPQQVMKESGAEIIRLWVSMVDYRDEVRLGKEVLSRTVEAYRKIRNTLGSTCSRICTTSIRPPTRWTDPPARGRSLYAAVYARLAERSSRPTRRRLSAIFHAVNEFVTVDLSAFYLDVSKDRLHVPPMRWNGAPPRRRST